MDRTDPNFTSAERTAAAVPPPSVPLDGAPIAGLARPSRLPLVLASIGTLCGLAGIALAAWTYMDGQREILRLSTELAQVRLSLDLYARGSNSDGEGLAALETRLTALEEASITPALPEIGPTGTAPSVAATPGAECLPSGMRLLVAAGDSYPICGQSVAVEVGVVDNGYIALLDGTTVPSGSTVPMPGTPCRIGVTSGGDEGLTGYAEIRVTC